MLTVSLLALFVGAVLAAPAPQTSTASAPSTTSSSAPSTASLPTTCTPHLDSKSGCTLLLRVALTPNLKACTPADGSCADFDASKITPVNGQTYNICGNGKFSSGNMCVEAKTILAAATALQFNCSSAGLVGGSVDVGGEVTIRSS